MRNKFLGLFLIAAFLISGSVFADVQMQSNGTNLGITTKINVKGGTTTRSGQTVTIDNTSLSGINWTAVTGIQSSSINWSNVNGAAPINSGGVNWANVNGLATENTGGVNWANINGTATINTGAVNWNNVNALTTINNGSINWTNLQVAASTANGVNWTLVSPTVEGINWYVAANGATATTIACWKANGQLGKCTTGVSGTACTACN